MVLHGSCPWLVQGSTSTFVFNLNIYVCKKLGTRLMHKWPSGLRRHVQVVILIGAGSNPVLCTYFLALALQFDVCS